jgi:hypothetical protein
MTETSDPTGTAGLADRHDRAQWRVKVTREAYAADVDEYRREYGKAEGERRFFAENAPTDVKEEEDNILAYGGISCLWQCLIGNGTATAGQTLTYFNNAQAAIGVGDSSTAEAATQTNLQAATNAYRQAMDATFPTHTDATTSGAATITFKVTVGTANANWAWAEWAVFNAVGTGSPPTGGRMLNRKAVSLGTKTSSASWALTVTITLS